MSFFVFYKNMSERMELVKPEIIELFKKSTDFKPMISGSFYDTLSSLWRKLYIQFGKFCSCFGLQKLFGLLTNSLLANTLKGSKELTKFCWVNKNPKGNPYIAAHLQVYDISCEIQSLCPSTIY